MSLRGTLIAVLVLATVGVRRASSVDHKPRQMVLRQPLTPAGRTWWLVLGVPVAVALAWLCRSHETTDQHRSPAVMGAPSYLARKNARLMVGSRCVSRRTAVVAAAAGLIALSPAAAEAGLAVVIGGSGRARPGERLVYRIDFRHAYDPRPLNGIAPGDHVSITLFPPACDQLCVVKRLSRGIYVPRRGRMHFSFRFPREYTVCSRAASGTGTACHRMPWQPGDRGILGITVHGFSMRCPSGSCRRSGSKTIVVR